MQASRYPRGVTGNLQNQSLHTGAVSAGVPEPGATLSPAASSRDTRGAVIKVIKVWFYIHASIMYVFICTWGCKLHIQSCCFYSRWCLRRNLHSTILSGKKTLHCIQRTVSPAFCHPKMFPFIKYVKNIPAMKHSLSLAQRNCPVKTSEIVLG